MSATQFLISRGRSNEFAKRVIDGDPATSGLVVALYKTVESDTTFLVRANKAAIDAANTECDFTNYQLKTLANVSMIVGATKNTLSANDVTWTLAGEVSAGNNHVLKMVLYYAVDTGNMSTAIPMSLYQFDVTTKGVDMKLTIPATGLSIN